MTAEGPCWIVFGGETVGLDPSGVLLLEGGRTLVVADLHFEKGSAFARRGVMLPPYDTVVTLDALAAAIERLRPERVVSLGDAFHDREGAAAMPPEAAARLGALVAERTWVWIRGNHDPEPPRGVEGVAAVELRVGSLVLRHEPQGGNPPQVAGHLHPKAKVPGVPSRPCFLVGATTLLLPAFGRLTGGLNVLDPVFAPFYPKGYRAYLLGAERIHRIPRRLLLPERSRPHNARKKDRRS